MTPMPFAAPIARALLRSQSDERLVSLARDGHAGAFDEIVRRYRAPLVAFAASYAPSEGAEDVIQESFASAWVALQASDREIALKPWLYAIVRNRSLNAKRDTRYHEQLDETIDGVRRPDEIFLQQDELRRAVAAVVALPEPQRKALVESAIEGRTHDQIAAELGTTAGSVRGLIHRGRVAARGAVGSIVPVPVVAWAAGSGGAAAGSAAAGSVIGGSLAAKGATVATIAVLATGSGLVVERSLDDSARSDREAGAETSNEDRVEPGPGNGDDETGGTGDADDRSKSESDRDAGRDEGDDDSSGRGDDDGHGGDNSGPGGDGGDDDISGRGGGDDDDADDNSGHGGGDDDDADDNSGHGGGDDDADDNSGSGGGDDDDNSGPGSGEDDSGSGEDDSSSGSGSDDDDSSGHGSGEDDD